MSEENAVATTTEIDNTAIMDQKQFNSFVKSSVTAFMGSHNLEKITVEDGTGRKATVKINKNGEYVVQITSKEVI